MSKQNVQTQRRYPLELRERAVRMVREAIAQAGGERHGVVTRVAIQLGMGSETLRHWVKQAEVDSGQRPGTTTEDRQRIAELERELRELRRANEIPSAGVASARCPRNLLQIATYLLHGQPSEGRRRLRSYSKLVRPEVCEFSR